MFKEVNQITLSANNDKGIQSIDPIETRVYGTSKKEVLYVKLNGTT